MSNKQISLSEIITAEEAGDLFRYVKSHQDAGTKHQHILDWLGRHSIVLERMQKHGLLLTYFTYQLEFLLFSK